MKHANFARAVGVFIFLFTSPTFSQAPVDESVTDALTSSLADHQAVVSYVSGEVRILKPNTEEWVPVKQKDIITEGDQIKTGSSASLDVVYDDSALNSVHIDENTIAEFRTIEPTDVYLTDGSIFNSLDGLPEGQTYEVATETAVNAIRGTKFMRSFDAASKNDNTVVSEGTVEAFAYLPDGSLNLEPVKIEKDKALTLTPELLKSRSFNQIQPERATPDHRQKMQALHRRMENGLERFAGGAENLRARREQAHAAMGQQNFRERFEQKREESRQRGPMHRPGGPERPGDRDGERNFRGPGGPGGGPGSGPMGGGFGNHRGPGGPDGPGGPGGGPRRMGPSPGQRAAHWGNLGRAGMSPGGMHGGGPHGGGGTGGGPHGGGGGARGGGGGGGGSRGGGGGGRGGRR